MIILIVHRRLWCPKFLTHGRNTRTRWFKTNLHSVMHCCLHYTCWNAIHHNVLWIWMLFNCSSTLLAICIIHKNIPYRSLSKTLRKTVSPCEARNILVMLINRIILLWADRISQTTRCDITGGGGGMILLTKWATYATAWMHPSPASGDDLCCHAPCFTPRAWLTYFVGL